MDPEKDNVEVDVDVETTEEKSPVMMFAEDVAKKAEMVEAGEMSIEDFVAQTTEELQNVQAPAEAMGGLGQGNGDFPDLNDLESE